MDKVKRLKAKVAAAENAADFEAELHGVAQNSEKATLAHCARLAALVAALETRVTEANASKKDEIEELSIRLASKIANLEKRLASPAKSAEQWTALLALARAVTAYRDHECEACEDGGCEVIYHHWESAKTALAAVEKAFGGQL